MTAPATAPPDADARPQEPPRTAPAGGMAPIVGGSDEMIEMEGATVRFGDLVAVRDVSITVPRGTILGIIGPSGAGKTTTIRLLTGGLAPSAGRIRVLGEDPRKFHRRTRERIGYMPQQFTLYPDLTAGENVDFVASLFGLLWFRRRRRVREVLHIVDLWDARKRRATNLSGGQQRRLELACALVHEPELLFLDEPTAGIDPLLRARVWEELHRIKASGRTMLVTTQYVNEAEECDMVALIAQGGLAALAPPEELRRMATGGDVLEIGTEKAFEASTLESLEPVRATNQISPRLFRVVVPDAASATPHVVAAIDRAGGRVVSAGEYRLTFDEIFAELVERNRRLVESETEAGEARDRNELEARGMVDRELRRREADAGVTPLDAQSTAGEARVASEAVDEAGHLTLTARTDERGGAAREAAHVAAADREATDRRTTDRAAAADREAAERTARDGDWPSRDEVDRRSPEDAEDTEDPSGSGDRRRGDAFTMSDLPLADPADAPAATEHDASRRADRGDAAEGQPPDEAILPPADGRGTTSVSRFDPDADR